MDRFTAMDLVAVMLYQSLGNLSSGVPLYTIFATKRFDPINISTFMVTVALISTLFAIKIKAKEKKFKKLSIPAFFSKVFVYLSNIKGGGIGNLLVGSFTTVLISVTAFVIIMLIKFPKLYQKE